MAKLKDGFYKLTASSVGSDLLVLLAGGGAKPISDFALFNNAYWANIPISNTSSTTTNPTFGGATINGNLVVSRSASSALPAIPLQVTGTGSDTGPRLILAFSPSLPTSTTASSGVHIILGVKESAYNLGYMKFWYAGDGSTSNALRFGFHNSDNLMAILVNGNVGIGTTSPGYKLDVNGAIRANGNVLLEAANSTTGGGIAFWDASGWVNGTINAKNLILNYAGGNVGIGTLNPSCKLEVNGPLKISDYIDIRESGGKNRFTAYVYSGIGRLYSYNDDTGYNDLYVGQNSTNAIVVKANGNVGIGTGSPTYKLDVNGDIATSLYLRIKAWSGYGSGSCDMWFDGNKTKLIMASGAVFGYNVDIEGTLHMTNDHKIFWHDDSANYYISSPNTATSAMLEYKAYGGHRFYGGNVGIGVESPEYKLHVSGSIYGSYGKFGGILINKGYGNNTGTDTIETATSGNMLYINYYHKGGLNLCLGGGNVGIGTTSPVHKLDVNGSIYGSHYYGNEITLYTRGNGTYTRAWITAKDSSGDFIIEAPLTTESESGTRAPITLTWRGGYPAKGGLKITGYSEAVLGGNKIWHAGNDGSGSGLDADLLDGKHLSSFITYELSTDYVGASFNSEDLSKKAASTYIEYWDGAGGWFNSRWGLVLAISGFHRVGSSDSYVLLGGGGHKAVSDFAPVSHSHSYVSTGGMVNGAYAVIPTYNGETGWHRIATIDGGTGYGSWILYLCGNWSWTSNTNAILHINTMHTTAKITQVSGIVGFVTDVRLVPISANNYYVDVYINYSGANTPGTVYCYFLGNGAITTRTTAEKITASVSTAASITLVTGTKTNDNSYAAHFYENSDAKLKTNVQNINSSDNMPLLKEFDWKSDGAHGYGLIAQELEAMGYPELVEGKDDGTKTVNYSAALSLIVGKLQVKIKELEKEIEILKNKN